MKSCVLGDVGSAVAEICQQKLLCLIHLPFGTEVGKGQSLKTVTEDMWLGRK